MPCFRFAERKNLRNRLAIQPIRCDPVRMIRTKLDIRALQTVGIYIQGRTACTSTGRKAK